MKYVNIHRSCFHIQISGLGSLKSFSTGTHYLRDQYYPADVFLPLKNVTKLSLICIYPNQLQSGFLQHMQKIEELTLVLGINASLGREFSHLKHLKYLAIKPGPKIMFKGRLTNIVLNISDDTLANVPQVERLLIEDYYNHPAMPSVIILSTAPIHCSVTIGNALKSSYSPRL